MKMFGLSECSLFSVRLWKSYKGFRSIGFGRIGAIRAAFAVSRDFDEISEQLADWFEKRRLTTMEPTGAIGVQTREAATDNVLHNRKRFDLQHVRDALLIASTAGLTLGLLDLSDLSEPMHGFYHPIIHLGAPIVAFGGALIAAFGAIMVARRSASTLSGASASLMNHRTGSSANEKSLRRACIILLALGSVAFGLAELAEHGSAIIDCLNAIDGHDLVRCVQQIALEV